MTGPRIVVLDGFSLNPGDLSWEPLASIGELSVHDRTPSTEVVERARGARIVLSNKTVLSAEALGALPELGYVGVLATGTNVVDRAAARARGIVVTNVPNYGADSVAEHTLSLMLESTKHLAPHTLAVRQGAWAESPDFSFTVAPVNLLAQKTLGIVGFGAIGQRVAELARSFKMSVLVAQHARAAIPNSPGLSACVLDELFRRSDIVSLHCPLTPETTHLIDARRLGLMKPTAVLVNTARGGLVDEAALAEALCAGHIKAAYLDVLAAEPPPANHALVALPNCWVTPHMAWASVEARGRLLAIAVDNVRAFLAGKPTNVVA